MTSLADVIIQPESESPTTKTVVISADPTATADSSANPQITGWAPPEKFKGKTLRDVVEAYQNLESQAGRMASDLGEQRKLTDKILDLDRKRADDLRKNGATVEPVTTDELLTKPQEAIERVLDARASQAIDPLNKRIAALEAALTEAAFRNQHTNADAIVNSPEFLDWVKASPLRMRAAQAANQGNWTAANDLLGEYKAQHPSGTSTQATDDFTSAKRAALETSGNVGGKHGEDGKPKGKLYSRAELMRLRISDPDAYYDEAFQAEVLRAHAEGRVR